MTDNSSSVGQLSPVAHIIHMYNSIVLLQVLRARGKPLLQWEWERQRERERGGLSRARRERALISIDLALIVFLSGSPCDSAKLYREYLRVAASWCCRAVHLILCGAFPPTTRTKRHSLGWTSAQGVKWDGERTGRDTGDFVTVSASSTTYLSLPLSFSPTESLGRQPSRSRSSYTQCSYITRLIYVQYTLRFYFT